MTEPVKEQSDSLNLQFVLVLILFHIISNVLMVWVRDSIAVGAAAFACALIIFRISPYRNLGFFRWALGSFLIVGCYAVLIYELFYPLARKFGAVIVAGPMTFFLVMLLLYIPEVFLKQKPRDGLWKWVAISAGAGLLLAFLAYLNPKGFSKP